MTAKCEFEKILQLSDDDFIQRLEQCPDLLTEECVEHPKIWHYAGKAALEKEDFSKLNLLVDQYISSANAFVLSNLMCLYAKANKNGYFSVCLGSEKAEPNQPGKYGYPLHWICSYGRVEMLKALFENSNETIDLNVQNVYGSTPIIAALKNGNIAIAHYLLAQKDISLAICSHISGSVLSAAIYYEEYDFVDALFKNEQLEKISNKSHPGALEWAILRNRVSIVEELLKRGFDPNVSVRDYGAPSPVKLSDLAEESYALTDDNEYDWYELPLLLAMEHKNSEIIGLLLEFGADIKQALWDPSEDVGQIDFGLVAEDYELKNNKVLYEQMSFYFSLQQYQYVITDQFDLLIDELYLQSPALLSLAYYFINDASFSAEEAHLFSQAVFPAEFGVIRNQFHLLYCAYHLGSQKVNAYPSNKALFDKTVHLAVGDAVKGEKIEKAIDYYRMLAFKAVNKCMVTISKKILDRPSIKSLYEEKVKKIREQLKHTPRKHILTEHCEWLINMDEVGTSMDISPNQMQSELLPKPFREANPANLMEALQLYDDTLPKKVVEFLQSHRRYAINEKKAEVIITSIKTALYREIHGCSWSCIPKDLLSSAKVGTLYYYYRTFSRSGEWEEIKQILYSSYKELSPTSDIKKTSAPLKTAFFHQENRDMSKPPSSPRLPYIDSVTNFSKIH